MSASIKVPIGSDVQMHTVASYSMVVVAPPGTSADLETLRKPGGLSALFTHDPGLSWPDDLGCRRASSFLAEGVPICLEFSSAADAVRCVGRLTRGTEH